MIDFRVEDGWLPWDRMEITKQKGGEIDFRALLGVPGKALPFKWHLSLGRIEADGFRARLTGEVFENRVDNLDTTPIDILFKRSAEAGSTEPGESAPVSSRTPLAPGR
jgi:hypothetical protein